MRVYTDQTGHTIQLQGIPQRIVSVVPSQSEFLWDLGLEQQLVGITKFCIHPETMFRRVERVGGTKKLDLDKIRALKPDLIIGNKEENERGDILALREEFPVWMSDIYTLEDAFGMMQALGEIVDRQEKTGTIVADLRQSMHRLIQLFARQRVAYFIWYKPYMLAAENTFIDHLLRHLGLKNVASDFQRYPEITEDVLKEMKPDVCFLSSEPFPFREQHVKELNLLLPGSQVLIVDGEVFSWYGTRLAHLEAYARTLPLEKAGPEF